MEQRGSVEFFDSMPRNRYREYFRRRNVACLQAFRSHLSSRKRGAEETFGDFIVDKFFLLFYFSLIFRFFLLRKNSYFVLSYYSHIFIFVYFCIRGIFTLEFSQLDFTYKNGYNKKYRIL